MSNLKEKVKAALQPIYQSQEVLEAYKVYKGDSNLTFGEFLVDYSEEINYHPETIEELMEG